MSDRMIEAMMKNPQMGSYSEPTLVEQETIDRSLANEIGQALGRIEAVIGSNAQQRPIGELFLACLQRFDEIDAQYSANCERYDDIHGQLARLDERLGAIEKRLDLIVGIVGKRDQPKRRQRRSKL